jgi:hypothetical protein
MRITSSFLLTAAAVFTFHAPLLAHGSENHSEKPQAPQDHKYYGASADFAGGKISTYIVLGKDKDEGSNRRKPLQLGIEIPKTVMDNLPPETSTAVLDFPIQARHTPFQFMMFDWNPQGHPPAGIYDKPHFDFHFYVQDLEDVMAIDPGPCSGLACDDYERARQPVPVQFIPPDYIDVGSVAPYMGNHLIDPTSPEFNGQPFTRTWIYGVYDGHVTFYEPMITRASILDQPNLCTPVKQPAAYEENGFYPTSYCTEFDAAKEVYRVYVKDFVYRFAPRGHGRR